MVSWSLWSAAAFPSSLRSRSRCLPLKLAEPAVADVVWSQWLPSLSSQRASGSCRHLLAILHLMLSSYQPYMTGGNLYLIFLWCMVNQIL
uniref:Uncharacterized protein n=1 Tax=Oryza rufipogon TaxID=4529 RepID=A0A0E0NPL7_ORYRU